MALKNKTGVKCISNCNCRHCRACKGEIPVPEGLFRVLLRKPPGGIPTREKSVTIDYRAGKEVDNNPKQERTMKKVPSVEIANPEVNERRPRFGFCHNCGEPINEICEGCPKKCEGENDKCPFNPDFVEIILADGKMHRFRISEDMKGRVFSSENMCGGCNSSWGHSRD